MHAAPHGEVEKAAGAGPARGPAPGLPSNHPSNHPLATRLAYAGLIPFVLGALLVWLQRPGTDPHFYVTLSLSAYAGVVVSFLGGIHWGLALRQTVPSPVPFAWGVVPSLAAWVGTVMPAYAGLVVQGVMLVLCYLVDRRLYPVLGASAWLTVRFRLSAVAALSCFIAAAGS
jgi:hypothetical protein